MGTYCCRGCGLGVLGSGYCDSLQCFGFGVRDLLLGVFKLLTEGFQGCGLFGLRFLLWSVAILVLFVSFGFWCFLFDNGSS